VQNSFKHERRDKHSHEICEFRMSKVFAPQTVHIAASR